MANNAKAKAEKVEEKNESVNIDTEKLTLKGKIHAEEYSKLKTQRIKFELEIEKIDVLLNYYSQTIKKEAEKWQEENKSDEK